MKREFALQKGGVLPAMVVVLGVSLLIMGAQSALAQTASTGKVPTQSQQTESVEERIRRVENGLLPAAVLRGEAPPLMKLEDRMRFHRTPGLSLVVINNGQIEWARSYGVKEAGGNAKVVLETLFQAASISKPVVAMGALRLVQQGKLSLDEDVNRKLQSWKVPETEFTKEQKVTIRRLL